MNGLSSDEFKGLLLSIGSHRGTRPLSPVEVAHCFDKMKRNGATLQQCAEIVHFDGTSMITRFLRLLTLNSEIQHLVNWGQSDASIAFTSAFEISKLDVSDQKKLAELILAKGISTSEVKQVVQSRLRSAKAIEACVADILELRPQVSVRHVLIGAIPNGSIREMLSVLSQAERDSEFRRILVQHYPKMERFSFRLGIERFTITGDAPAPSIAGVDKDSFEQMVLGCLEKGLKSK